MKKATIYIETSVISYLAARPSPDLTTAACQQVTAEWWENHRHYYDVVTSALVLTEAGEGDPLTAKKRLDLLKGIPVLRITNEAAELARILTAPGAALPRKAQADALHIAIAAVHNADFLLTWNCRHIDNPATKPLVRKVCNLQGYNCPEICTPFEIMEIDKNEK
jgi:predicted nucleic acid-binding protein